MPTADDTPTVSAAFSLVIPVAIYPLFLLMRHGIKNNSATGVPKDTMETYLKLVTHGIGPIPIPPFGMT